MSVLEFAGIREENIMKIKVKEKMCVVKLGKKEEVRIKCLKVWKVVEKWKNWSGKRGRKIKLALKWGKLQQQKYYKPKQKLKELKRKESI